MVSDKIDRQLVTPPPGFPAIPGLQDVPNSLQMVPPPSVVTQFNTLLYGAFQVIAFRHKSMPSVDSILDAKTCSRVHPVSQTPDVGKSPNLRPVPAVGGMAFAGGRMRKVKMWRKSKLNASLYRVPSADVA